jgi:hypothetical protein
LESPESEPEEEEESSRRTEEAMPLRPRCWRWAETALALSAKDKEAANSLLNFIVVDVVVTADVVGVNIYFCCRLNL